MSEFAVLFLMLWLNILCVYHLNKPFELPEVEDSGADYTLIKKKTDTSCLPNIIAGSFEWTFLVALPAIFYNHMYVYVWAAGVFIATFVVHAIIKFIKANKDVMNTTGEHVCYILQVLFVWFMLVHISD